MCLLGNYTYDEINDLQDLTLTQEVNVDFKLTNLPMEELHFGGNSFERCCELLVERLFDVWSLLSCFKLS